MIKPVFATTDFELTFEKLKWAKETYEDFPVLRWPSGSICEPATLFFGYSLQYRRGVGISSLSPEAFALREWLCFLANRRVPYDRAEDLLMKEFREQHRDAILLETVHPHTVERKLSTIYLFYRCLDQLLATDDKGRLRPRLVAPDETDRTYPITTASYETTDGVTKFVWSESKVVAPKGTKRPTPDLDEVAKVLTWIRSRPDRLIKAGKTPTPETYLLADRDYMMARTESEGGYRRKEVSGFSIRHIHTTLKTENIAVPSSALELAACNPPEQARIISELEALHENNPYVELWVNGKGDKPRYAPVPVLYLIDLLKIWIWGGRQSLMERSDQAIYEVFISTETIEKLNPGSIGNIMKSAFNGANVSGSGQRLRAHYCTLTAFRLWEDAMRRNGFNFSQAVYNMVLDRLADAMGHDKADTTVKYYLDDAVNKYYGFSERSKYIVFNTIWTTVADNYAQLGVSDIKTILKVIEAFAKPNTEQLKQVIALALAREDLNPEPPAQNGENGNSAKPDTPKEESHLRLAFSYRGPDRTK